MAAASPTHNLKETTILCSPTEPDALRALGETSSAVETFGVDFMWVAQARLFGAQRKEFGDFISSIQGGGETGERLAKESIQSKRLHASFLIIEGTPHWTTDGQLVDRFRRFTRRQYRMLLVSLQYAGFWIVHTDSIEDTASILTDLQRWTEREHLSLLRRPGPESVWGSPDNTDYRRWLWQSLPGIGPANAGAIDKHFDGRIPLQLTCTREELMKVKGLGQKKVQAIIDVLGLPADEAADEKKAAS